MIYFLLAVAFTVALYVIMRSFPKWKVDTFHAVVFNYYACVLTGALLTPDLTPSIERIDWASSGTIYTLALGALFIVVFLLIGRSTLRAGVTAASLAANLSLVIPVLFGLFVFHNAHKEFTALNYLGLALTLPALALGAWKGKSMQVQKHALIWPMLCFVASGANNTLINYLTSTYYSPGSQTIFMMVACAGAVGIGTALVVFRALQTGQWPALRSIAAGFLLGIPNFLSLYFLLKALTHYGNSAAFVFPVYNILTMLASAFVAYILFSEKLEKRNKVGVLIAILAILLISHQELGLLS
jgi:drug/metabolite transporter (DMT)-like permease